MTGTSTRPTRRQVLLGGAGLLTAMAAQSCSASTGAAEIEPGRAVPVTSSDPRYADLVRGVNRRWTGTPREVWVARSAEDVRAGIDSAVRLRVRPTVRSGGHCFEDFTTARDIGVLVDVSGIDAVDYDPSMRAFVVGAGADLGTVYTELFKRWGVTLPGGSCPTVGVGGHVAGGGYGPLNRSAGLIVDHLYAVEVVVNDGQVHTVVATRETDDPNRDLWWAHTGGGGNVGVVTRYWFRTPGASQDAPATQLPAPPPEMLVSTVIWPWSRLDRGAFVRLVRNYTEWFAAHNQAGTPEAGLYAHLAAFHASGGTVALNVQVGGVNAPEVVLDRFLAAVAEGITPPQTVERTGLPWLTSTQWAGFADRPVGKRIKGKSAMHHGALDEYAATAMHRSLTRGDYAHPGSGILIAPYGGQVNTARPDATAAPHRDCAITLLFVSEWTDPAEDDRHIGFLRTLYRDVYGRTGGAPVPGDDSAGAYINYPDVDMLDPAWNTSGVPWPTLYHRDQVDALRAVKARWDPGRIFGHRMSI